MHQDEASKLRHAIRGTINALKLGASVLEAGLNAAETLEFLTYIDAEADRMAPLLDAYDALPPDTCPPQSVGQLEQTGE